jgi:preprotein translocase SecE subunit
MFSYRPDQGVYGRGIAFWSLTIYAGLAGNRFYYWVQRFDWTNKRLLADEIPVLALYLTPALLLGVGVFSALAWGVWKLVNHPKIADLLIDTEAEMKKVTWPTFEDCKNSSLIVIGCVVFMLAFLWFTDTALGWFFTDVVY